MPDHGASTFKRFMIWAVACAVLLPLVCGALLAAGYYGWWRLLSLSASLTVELFALFEGVAASRGHVAESLSLVLAAAFVAPAPAVATALFRRSWRGAAETAATLYPAWLVVLALPSMVIYEYAPSIDRTYLAAHLTCAFILLFAAGATAVGLAYSLWARLEPAASQSN